MHDGKDREPERPVGRPPDAAKGELAAVRLRQKKRRSWGKDIASGAALVALGALCATGIILFLIKSTGDLFGLLEVPAPIESTPAPESHPIALQAEQWGISDCVGKIADLSNYLTLNTDHTWLAQRGEEDANRQVFSATIAARERTTGVQGLSKLFAAPVGENNCNAGYQTTIYFPSSCPQAHQALFPSFATRLQLGDIVEAYANADRATLFLLPAGASGCVLVKSELFY